MIARPSGRPARLFPLFAVLSLAAVAIGCFIASVHGATAATWIRDMAAWAVGGAAALAIARWGGDRTMVGFLAVAPVGLATTLLSAGPEGVHRWIDLGPVHINVALVLLPPAIVAFAALAPRHRWTLGVAAALAGLLIAQPDASQATAFGGAVVLIAAFAPLGAVLRVGGIALGVLPAIAAWLRPDPLAPVPTVEGIMGLAWSLSPLTGILGWTALAGALLTPLAASRSSHRSVQVASVALAIYAVLVGLAPLFGAFPVPLVGMGMSPILGLWLGTGLLAALAARPMP